MTGAELAQQVRFHSYEVTTQWSDGDEHHAEIVVDMTDEQQTDYVSALRLAVSLSEGDSQTLVRVYADGVLRTSLLHEDGPDHDGDCDRFDDYR